jgi:hypothetical protein
VSAASLILLCSVLLGAGDVNQQLKSAIEDFEFGDHAVAQKKLEGLLNPITLDSMEDVIVARQYLGACYFLTDLKSKAEAEFAKILALDPEHKLDPQVFSPALVQFFEDVRARTGLELRRAKSEPAPPKSTADPAAGPPADPARAKTDLALAPRPPLALAFLPFGVGQFNNDQPVRGALFGGLEVALLTTALTTFLMFNSLQVTDLGNGQVQVRPEDKDRAATLQTISLSTFYAGLGVAALGIVEALVSYPGARGEAGR